jgi:hypothetical protein
MMGCRSKLPAVWFVVALSAGVGARAYAQDATSPAASTPPSPEASSPAPPASSEDGMLDTTQRSVRSLTEWVARRVDRWFGDRPFEDGGKVSDGQLSVSLFKRDSAALDVDVRFNAHFRLPNIEQKAYVFIGRDNPRDVITDAPDARSRQQQLLSDRPKDRSFLAGLGLSVLDTVDFRLGVSARLKPYVQARYDQPWELAPGHSIGTRETLFWTHDDRFGSTTTLTYAVAVAPDFAVRWLNAATITQNSRNFEWSSTLGAYQSLGEQRLLSLELLVSGTGTHGLGAGMSDLGVLAKWEEPIYKTWLSAEIVGGHFWLRPDALSERGRAWALGGSLKLRF